MADRLGVTPALSPSLIDAALRLAGAWPESWLCPVCGAVIRDIDLAGDRPPVHEHYGHAVAFVQRPEMQTR